MQKIKILILTIAVILCFASITSAGTHPGKSFYSGAYNHPALPERDPILIAIAGAGQGSGSHGTTLNWTASTSAPGCVTPCQFGYNVYRGTTASGESATPLNSTPLTSLTYTDTVTITNSPQTFFYTVEAVETTSGITLNSVPSNEVSVTFPGAPAPPTSVVGSPH